MQDHQKLVVTEKAELDEKIARLDGFLRSEKSIKVDNAELERMARQSTAMQEYARILDERIKEF